MNLKTLKKKVIEWANSAEYQREKKEMAKEMQRLDAAWKELKEAEENYAKALDAHMVKELQKRELRRLGIKEVD